MIGQNNDGCVHPASRHALPWFSGRTLCRWGSAWWPCGTSSRACPARCHGALSTSPAGEENLNKPTGPLRPSSRREVGPALTSSVDRLWILPECRITRSKRSATLRRRQPASPGGHTAGGAAARTSSHSSASAAPGPAENGASGVTDPQFRPLHPGPSRPVPSSRSHSVPSPPARSAGRPRAMVPRNPLPSAERSGSAAPIYAVGCARRGGRSWRGPPWRVQPAAVVRHYCPNGLSWRAIIGRTATSASRREAHGAVVFFRDLFLFKPVPVSAHQHTSVSKAGHHSAWGKEPEIGLFRLLNLKWFASFTHFKEMTPRI